jgi:hypothetical protein
MRDYAAAWLLVFWLLVLWLVLAGDPVKADVAVSANGCNIVLRHAGATGVTIAYDDPALPIEDPYQIVNGTGSIDMLAEYGIVYAAGSYTVTWNDGTVEHFTLTCPADYDPASDPSAPPVTFSGPPVPDLPLLAVPHGALLPVAL